MLKVPISWTIRKSWRARQDSNLRTPGLEILREEAIGGSRKPLPHILRASSHTRDNSKPPRAATRCQSFVSRLSPLDDDEFFVGDSVSNPDTRSRDLDERLTSFQRDDNRAEVGFDAAQQFHPPRVSDPNPDDGRTFLQNPANREVLIFCHDHGVGLRCVAANRIVGRSRKPTIEDMLGRVAECFDAPRQRRWQLSVDEKAQSRAPQDRVIVLAGGEFQYCRDVFRPLPGSRRRP